MTPEEVAQRMSTCFRCGRHIVLLSDEWRHFICSADQDHRAFPPLKWKEDR